MSKPIDLDHEAIRGCVQRIYRYEQIGSTNDAALTHARQSPSEFNELFIAERQTAGRGRGANSWWAGPGGLTFTLLTAPIHVAPERIPAMSLAVGVGLCEAIDQLAPATEPRLKWPNDLYLRDSDGAFKKAAGVLIEVDAARPPRLAIGVGMNINTAMANAPDDVRNVATSLLDAARAMVPPNVVAEMVAEFDRTEVLGECLAHIIGAINGCRTGDPAVPNAWRRYSLLTGKQVRIDAAGREIVGLCESIDDDGRLAVRTPSGVEHCISGVVCSFS